MTRQFTKTGEIRIDNDDASFVYITASAISNLGASSTSDGQIYVFDSESAKVVSKFQAHNATIMGLCMNDHSQVVASCADYNEDNQEGNEVALWDIRSSTEITRFYPRAYFDYIKHTFSTAMSSDGQILAAGTDGGVICWDVRNPELSLKQVNLQPSGISSIEFHPFASNTFLAGDDDGNLLLYDIDAASEEDSILFYSNDQYPVFQCGFCGVDVVYTLRRTAGIRLWNIMDPAKDAAFYDAREKIGQAFSYPIDCHWCGEWLMLVGGDSDGGVALSLCSAEDIVLFNQIKKAHNDCVNCSHIALLTDGTIKLYLGGDHGQLSFWVLKPEAE